MRTQPETLKRSEFTYGVTKDALALIAPDNAATLFDAFSMAEKLRQLDLCLIGARRSFIDVTEILRQFIPYTLVFKVLYKGESNEIADIKFAVYLRNKKNGEQKLATNYSLGVGGHVESCDTAYYGDAAQQPTTEIDVRRMLGDTCLREFQEEVSLDANGDEALINIEPVGFVMDSKPEVGYVGNTHVGLIYGLRVPSYSEFQMAEEINDAIGWFNMDELREFGKDHSFEPWSRMIIDQVGDILGDRLIGAEINRVVVAEEVYDSLVNDLEKPKEPNPALVALLSRPRAERL